MANEAQIQSGLRITKDSLIYQSQPTSFLATVDGAFGPTPGALMVPTTGRIVDLSLLTTPGLYRIINLDDTNYVEYGILDPQTNKFYPWGEILPGESYVGRFSRNLQEEYVGTGTGTSAPTNVVLLKATGGTCTVLVEAFEK